MHNQRGKKLLGLNAGGIFAPQACEVKKGFTFRTSLFVSVTVGFSLFFFLGSESPRDSQKNSVLNLYLSCVGISKSKVQHRLSGAVWELWGWTRDMDLSFGLMAVEMEEVS